MTRRGLLRKLRVLPFLLPVIGPLLSPRGSAAEHACEDTSLDILGPYYAANAPLRTVIASPDEPGKRIFISGTIRAADCHTPIPGCLIEIWHANDDGCYSIHQTCNTGSEDPFNLRGRLVTDASGKYEFETILPGRYGFGTFRPRHIHFKITSLEIVK